MSLPLFNEIRRLVVTLAFERFPEPYCCRDWTVFHGEIVRAHELVPWLYKSLGGVPETGMPREISGALQKDYMLSVKASMTREWSLKQILAVLNAHGVTPVLLKGAYLGPKIYGDPALRTMCDIDLLARKEDLNAARNALTSLGYRIQFALGSPEDRILQLAETHIHDDDRFTTVDLHRSLGSMDFYRFPPADVWSQVTEGNLYGHKVLFLSPELNFICVAVHALNHGAILRDWLDMVLILKRTAFDWGRFADLSRSLGVIRPLWWTFRELGAHWESNPPTEIGNMLDAYHPHWLEDRIIGSRWTYAWRLLAKMRLLESRESKMRFWRSRLLPSRSYREAVVGTDNWMPYFASKLGYFIRLRRRS
jgi:hypothetical protein